MLFLTLLLWYILFRKSPYVRFGPGGSPTPTATSTPTARPPDASVRFAVIGDFGADTSALQDVSAVIQAQNVDLMVTVGDNRYSVNAFDTVIGQYFCDFLAGVSGGNN